MSQPKIAVLLSRFPYPLDKGDKLRAFHQLKYLSKFYKIYLFALSDIRVTEPQIEPLKEICESIQIYKLSKFSIFKNSFKSIFKLLPIQVGYFYSDKLKRRFEHDLNRIKPDLVYAQLSRTALYTKDLDLPKIIDFQDAFSANYKRMSIQSKGIKRIFYKRESRLMSAFEQQMASWFDATTIITEADRNDLSFQPNDVHVVPNGVDCSHFKRLEMDALFDIVFVGNLSYAPNRNAVQYLVENIFPKLKHIKPDIQIAIVGASPNSTLKKYENENITISGWVDDIREAYSCAKVFVAPLFTGAGMQNKLLEAMCMNIPCVTTTLASTSLGATDEQELLVANDVQEFVQKIVLLLENESRRISLREKANKFVKSTYQWEQVNVRLKNLIDAVITKQQS